MVAMLPFSSSSPPSCLVIIVAMSMVLGCFCDGPTIIHVSPTGNDDNDGSSGAPLRTFGAAQSKARKYHASTSVTIQFEEGLYPLSRTQQLTQEDSGAAGSPRVYTAAPGAKVTLTGDVPVVGWRAVENGDAAWQFLDDDARASVVVAPLPEMHDVPKMLYDAAAEAASPAARAVRLLPDTNVVSSLVPEARKDSEACMYLGQFKSEHSCSAAALKHPGLWAYAWHDPAVIEGDFAEGCYGRWDVHGSRKFQGQNGVMSAVFAASNAWREVTDWEISNSVTTQHRCPGAECEYFDSEVDKSTMHVSLDHLEQSIGNRASSLSLRIYLVDFAMNVLPVASVTSSGQSGSIVQTAYAGTLQLGQKPGYCDQDYDENKCSPAIWLLNTMKFSMPGQFAINTQEGTVYYWPALASKDVSGVSLPATSTLISLHSASKEPVEHVSFIGLNFAHGNHESLQRGDAGGIQHNWAMLQSSNSLVTLNMASDITISSCSFRNSGGGGVRADGFAQKISVANNIFENLGYEAVGIYGMGLGITQVTFGNSIVSNDVSHTALVKFDSPAIVVWNAAHTSVLSNFIHDTSARALYVGGSRYCSKPDGFATDGGIMMNQWDQLTDANIPDSWLKMCKNNSYAYTFADDCKCAFFRGAQGSVIQKNIFARVTQHKDRPFFSDGLVYVSGPGYVEQPSDVTVFEDNTYIASPGKGAPSFRMLYVDGYTGSMRISRNAVVDGNAHQGFMLCNWYGQTPVQANVLQLGAASWGSDYEISANCDGNPIMTVQANLVLSDLSSASHQPDADFVDDYLTVYDTVCAASIRAEAPSPEFLSGLNKIITNLGGSSRKCDGLHAQNAVLV